MMLCYICIITKSCNTISNYNFLFSVILFYGILFYIALPCSTFIDQELWWYGRQSQITVSYTTRNIRCHINNNKEYMRCHLTISTKLNTGYCCLNSVLCKTIYHDTTLSTDRWMNTSLLNRLFDKKIRWLLFNAWPYWVITYNARKTLTKQIYDILYQVFFSVIYQE